MCIGLTSPDKLANRSWSLTRNWRVSRYTHSCISLHAVLFLQEHTSCATFSEMRYGSTCGDRLYLAQVTEEQLREFINRMLGVNLRQCPCKHPIHYIRNIFFKRLFGLPCSRGTCSNPSRVLHPLIERAVLCEFNFLQLQICLANPRILAGVPEGVRLTCRTALQPRPSIRPLTRFPAAGVRSTSIRSRASKMAIVGRRAIPSALTLPFKVASRSNQGSTGRHWLAAMERRRSVNDALALVMEGMGSVSHQLGRWPRDYNYPKAKRNPAPLWISLAGPAPLRSR